MSTILVKDVRLFDPGAGIDAKGRNVVVDGDRIGSVDASPNILADRVIDGGGRLLVPGLIDLRVHACEPGFTRRETIQTASSAAAAGGITTYVAMPTTNPPVDRAEVVELISARARESGATRVLPAGTVSVGREGARLAEMAKLKSAGCVLFTDADRSVKDSQLLRYALETAGDLGMPIVTHAEDESLSLGGVMHEGLVAARLGLAGAPGAAEVVGIARDIALAELTGSRLHVGHVSTAAGVDLIRQAKKRGIRVTADVSPLHLLLTDEALTGYDTSAKIFPPLRPQADRDAVVAGLSDGTIDCVASDHNPQTDLDKNVEMDHAAPGAIGLETMLSVVLELVANKRLTLERAITTMTRGPANMLGRLELGRVKAGGPADFALIDRDDEWTYAEPLSRSHNSPLLGRTFKGRAVLTVASGVVTHEVGA